MRYKSDYRSASKETYKSFNEANPSVKITYEQYCDIIYKYNSLFMEEILETGDAIPFPRGLGKLSINRKKTTSIFTDKNGKDHVVLPIDWVESKKKGKIIHYYNDHTDGWKFKWLWFPNTSTNLKMKEIWSFKPARIWSHALRDKVVGEDKQKYIYLYNEWLVGRSKRKKK